MNGVDTAVGAAKLGLFVSCLLGCLLAVYLAKRNYVPIRRIVGKVSTIAPEKRESNEYAYIDNAIN